MRIETTCPHDFRLKTAIFRDSVRSFNFYKANYHGACEIISDLDFRIVGRTYFPIKKQINGFHLWLRDDVVTAEFEMLDGDARYIKAEIEDWLRNTFHFPVIDFRTRIFGTGFQKTGTTSLTDAFRRLGISSQHNCPWVLDDLVKGVFTDPVFSDYTALTDNPIPLFFEQIDRQFPNSKFIHTVRNTDSWLKSAEVYLSTKKYPMETFIYGVDTFDPTIYRKRYDKHNRDVTNYFADKKDRFMVIDFELGTTWEPICEFLQLPTPREPFPWKNRKN